MNHASRTAAIAALLAATAAGPAAVAAPASAPADAAFAVVNGTAITLAEYDTAYLQTVRRKFYHRAPPEGEAAALRREVGDKLIERVLLLAEGARRGVKPEADAVSAKLAGYDQQYGDSPQWRARREALLPGLRRELEEQSVLAQLERQVRTVRAPAEKEVRDYYAAHQPLFTQPEQVRLSVILLRVDPSSTKIVWDKAREEGAEIVKRLAGGADFAQLARLHSGDPSAEKGGDMGYIHRGMLPEAVHQAVDKLKPGEVAEPVRVLEGVAVLRLESRRPSRLMEFAQVRQRAADLWAREQAERQWKALIAKLRSAASIKILDPSRYPALPAAAASAGKTPPSR